MRVRSVEERDQEAVLSLVRQFQEHLAASDEHSHEFISDADLGAYVTQMRLDATTREGVFLVAEVEGKVVGLVAGIIDRHNGDVMHKTTHGPSADGCVGVLSVGEAHRGRGVGRALLDATVEHFVESDCTTLKLLVHEGNESARRFYERYGMKPSEIELSKPIG